MKTSCLDGFVLQLVILSQKRGSLIEIFICGMRRLTLLQSIHCTLEKSNISATFVKFVMQWICNHLTCAIEMWQLSSYAYRQNAFQRVSTIHFDKFPLRDIVFTCDILLRVFFTPLSLSPSFPFLPSVPRLPFFFGNLFRPISLAQQLFLLDLECTCIKCSTIEGSEKGDAWCSWP